MSQCARVDGSCKRCEGNLPFEFTMAFQPIVDIALAQVVTYEALVRGINGESAWSVISQVTDELLYRFDQACRVKAIEMASALDMQTDLSINFLPNAVYEPEACIQATLDVSRRVGWPMDRLVFEITETERVRDRQHLCNIIDAYRSMGFKTALDDFGNGYANLDLLTDLTPDKLKIDRALVMDCDSDVRRQALLNAIITLAQDLDMTLIAEGVETRPEALWLARAGIVCQQGFYFARPAVNSLGDDITPLLAGLKSEAGIALGKADE
ncbi:EAL domain-containing protein [Halovibrio sp. HP20-50]|uniref:EAL domain-containing protein n=1 Tax=Halovibrio sp. HP20-59 TaxID=3080275 RepID=UPI00294AB26E|nr:EAL domain-containing protein [Halovibrio sp. HP20-59]MEA2119838.1 EAL domain-containing protein [Halovibrio sp. HP20-59]